MWWLQDTAYEEAGRCGDNTSYPQGYRIPQCTPHQVFYSSFLLESMDVFFLLPTLQGNPSTKVLKALPCRIIMKAVHMHEMLSINISIEELQLEMIFMCTFFDDSSNPLTIDNYYLCFNTLGDYWPLRLTLRSVL